MKFETYIPCDVLKPFVKSFAVHEVREESTYEVLPDTGLVIGFQYKGRLARLQDEGETSLSVSGISGLADHIRTFKNSPDIGTVLVFFKEAGATQFFKQPLHELFRESVSLDNFMLRSELLCLEEQLAEAKTDAQRVTAVEHFLISRMTNTEPDKLVLVALALIHKSRGKYQNKGINRTIIHQSKSIREKISESCWHISQEICFHCSSQKYHSTLRLRKLSNSVRI